MDDDHLPLVRLLMDDRFRAWVHHPTPVLDQYWERQLQDDPEAQQVVKQARQMLRRIDFPKSKDIRREEILKKALMRAKNESFSADLSVSYPHGVPQPTVSRRRTWYWAAAAAGLIGLLFAVGYLNLFSDVQTYETAYGESQQIVLPDGSEVMLNANSTLRHPKSWDKDHPRVVELTGEAFFSVTHQINQQKFMVKVNELAIEVLGTEFNVNHRRGETEVVLERGSIRLDWSAAPENSTASVQDSAMNLVIEPGELVVFSEARRSLVRKAVDTELYSSWTDRLWLFDKMPLPEVIAMIEDNYGLRVIVKDPSILNKVFTAEIHEANLDLLLTFLTESFDLTITKDYDTVTIDKEGSGQ